MHKITDKLHHRHQATSTEHTPVSTQSAGLPQATVGAMPVLDKTFTSQGTFVAPLQQSTFQTTTITQQPILTQNIETVHVTTLAPVVETRVRAPIVQQTTRIDKVTEIQPIVHREIEATQVHLVEKHIYEKVPSSGPSMVTNQAIVEEVVMPRVLEQIQPVLHRNVPAPFIERVEEHITERVVQPTTTTKQVLSETRALSLEEASSRGFVSAPAPIIETAPIVHTTTAAPLMESRTRSAIVEQTTRAERIVEIQPIVHREIEAPEVHLIEKHSYEKVRSAGPGLITNQAIVEEKVTPRIIEQIQPIVHRSVPAPFVERVEEHINERVVAPTTTSKQVLSEKRMAAPVVISQQPAVTAPIVQHSEAAPIIENRQRSAIVEQTVRPERIVEIQPIVHREIEAPEVHLIEQHSYEKVRSAGPGMITNQPIIEEKVTPHIIEQIQPVVHRSVPAPFVERVEEHINERVVAPTTTSKQVLTERRVAAPVTISAPVPAGPPVVHHTEAAPIIENRQRSAVIEQTTRPERIVEIQPIVHREIEAPEVHLIEKHSYEKVRSAGPGMVTNQPIIEEKVTPHIIEQIQPVVHRSVPAPFIERVEEHINEKVVAPTTTTKQVLSEKRMAAPVVISQQPAVTAPIVQHTEAAPIIENRQRSAIVQQTVRPEKITEVQPVIHREIEAPEVHLIEKHSYEKVRSAGPSMITNQAIVEEKVTPHIIEQIQPVVHRSVPAPFVERVEEHITEKVVAPTTTTKQVLSEKRMAAPVVISQQPAITAPIIQHTEAAPIIENRQRSAIVQQTARPEKITEVQPVIHREIEAPEVHLIEKHSYEKVRSAGPSMITNQAIIEEKVTPHIIEQIQPVVHRSVPAPFVERVEEHINEKVVAPTTTTKQVLSEKRMAAPVVISQQPAVTAPIIQHTEAALIIENRQRSAIVQQTARPERITEVQPVIHREIEAPEVHLIEKHSYEKVRSTGPSMITKGAIVEEKVTPHIIEQIQPVVHRSVPAPFIERVEEHINEKVVAPTTTSKQVLSEKRMAAPVVISQQPAMTAPIVQHSEAAPIIENRQRSAIVQQTARPERITEVQPVIHREIEAPEVHLIEKHSYEKVRSTGPSMITKGAIVEETIIPKIIEEIQPVIHREVPQTVVEHVEQHVSERVVAPTTTSKQVVSEQRVAAAVPLPTLTQQRSTTPIVHSSTAATVTQSVTKPMLVEQTARPEKITEVQPVIHREIDAPEVHLIEKHMYEKVPSAGPGLITKQAIVEETVQPRVIEEIQPVVHRNVAVPFVERVEQHVSEHIVKPTVATKEVIVEKAPVLAKTTTTTTTTTTAPVAAVLPTATTTTSATKEHKHRLPFLHHKNNDKKL